MGEIVFSYNHLSSTKILSLRFNSYLWKIIIRELFFPLVFGSIFSLLYVDLCLVISYPRRDWVGEMTLVSDFIAGNFSFPSVSSPGRQMDAHTPQLVQFPPADQVLCVGLLARD